MHKRDRAALLLIGMLLGFGLPFLIAGMFLQVTGSVMHVEIVKQ